MNVSSACEMGIKGEKVGARDYFLLKKKKKKVTFIVSSIPLVATAQSKGWH